jgi:hypothetical protein
VPLSERIIAESRALVGLTAAGRPAPARKFLFEVLCGRCASGPVLLTEVGRKPVGLLHRGINFNLVAAGRSGRDILRQSSIPNVTRPLPPRRYLITR